MDEGQRLREIVLDSLDPEQDANGLARHAYRSLTDLWKRSPGRSNDVLADVRNRGAWKETFVDALCEPPETFAFGGMSYPRMIAINVCGALGSTWTVLDVPWSARRAWSERKTRLVTMSTKLLRFNGAVERDPAIDRWMKAHDGELGAIALEWFERMRECGDEVRELLHDGCPVACFGDAPFGYVNVFQSHVNVGFFQGASLPDPAHLLQGDGRFMRHVKLRPGTAVNTAALRGLIETAYSDIKARVEHG